MRYIIQSDKPVHLKSECGKSTIDGAGQSVVLSYEFDKLQEYNKQLIREMLNGDAVKAAAEVYNTLTVYVTKYEEAVKEIERLKAELDCYEFLIRREE